MTPPEPGYRVGPPTFTDHRTEDVGAVRGVVYGVAVAVGLWLVLVGVWSVVGAVTGTGG